MNYHWIAHFSKMRKTRVDHQKQTSHAHNLNPPQNNIKVFATSGNDCKEFQKTVFFMQILGLVLCKPVCLKQKCFCGLLQNKGIKSLGHTGIKVSTPDGFDIWVWVSAVQNTDWKTITWHYKTFKRKKIFTNMYNDSQEACKDINLQVRGNDLTYFCTVQFYQSNTHTLCCVFNSDFVKK